MRREHNKEQSYIDWLKSLGCVFYAPLTNGDLTDHISGNDLTLTGYGSLSWDNNVGMYLFTSPTTYPQGVLRTSLNYTKRTNQLTTIAKIKAGTKNSSGIGIFNSNTLLFSGGCDGKTYNNSITSIQNNWANKNSSFYHAYVLNYDGNNYNFAVQDGQQYWSNTYNYINYFGIGIGCKFEKINISQSYSSAQSGSYYNYNGATTYYADIMVFDIALDLATIRKIQGYE